MRRKKILFFSYGERYSGVYRSQVLEVIQSLRNYNGELDIQLLSIISPWNFFQEKQKLKRDEPKAIVLPAVGPMRKWNLNKIWTISLKNFLSYDLVYARGPFAACIAIDTFRTSKVIYDGRGAILAEQNEYDVFKDTGLEGKIEQIEGKAILESDGRIAVSHKLVTYWKKHYGYNGADHQVIPCTVSPPTFNSKLPNNLEEFLLKNKSKIKFTFAGGNAKWQGIENVVEFLNLQLKTFSDTCAILFTPENELIKKLSKKYPGRILVTRLNPEQVITGLSRCDYGLLLREKNITNKVASPVKVAEYLQAGLKVLISPEIGDYSEEIQNNNKGSIIQNKDDYKQRFEKISDKTKSENTDFCNARYSKGSIDIMKKYLSFS